MDTPVPRLTFWSSDGGRRGRSGWQWSIRSKKGAEGSRRRQHHRGRSQVPFPVPLRQEPEGGAVDVSGSASQGGRTARKHRGVEKRQ